MDSTRDPNKSVELPGSFAVKVTPRASRSEVVGWANGMLVVRVTAAPTDGKANRALIELLSDFSGLPKSAFTIVRGHTSRIKHIKRG